MEVSDSQERYGLILSQAEALLTMERDPITQMANLSALLYEYFGDINWCGFYRYMGERLLLGPFQGKIACVSIPMGKGVCGTAAFSRQTVVVPDVHLFEGHIACDSASRSEIVIPMLKEDRLLGVMDIDSASLNRFGDEEKALLESLSRMLIAACDWAPAAGIAENEG